MVEILVCAELTESSTAGSQEMRDLTQQEAGSSQDTGCGSQGYWDSRNLAAGAKTEILEMQHQSLVMCRHPPPWRPSPCVNLNLAAIPSVGPWARSWDHQDVVIAPPFVQWNRNLQSRLEEYEGVNALRPTLGRPPVHGEQEGQMAPATLALEDKTNPGPPGNEKAVERFNEIWDERELLRDAIEYETFYTAGQSKETATQQLQEASCSLLAARKEWRTLGMDISADARKV